MKIVNYKSYLFVIYFKFVLFQKFISSILLFKHPFYLIFTLIHYFIFVMILSSVTIIYLIIITIIITIIIIIITIIIVIIIIINKFALLLLLVIILNIPFFILIFNIRTIDIDMIFFKIIISMVFNPDLFKFL